MTSLHYSVAVSHGRGWGFRYQWLGWRRVLSVGIGTNLLAPAICINLAGVSIHTGRIPKETVIAGTQLLDEMKGKVND